MRDLKRGIILRTKEEIQKAVREIRPQEGKPIIDQYVAGYLQALAWVLDEDVP